VPRVSCCVVREEDDNVAHPDWCICVCKDSDTFHHMVGHI